MCGGREEHMGIKQDILFLYHTKFAISHHMGACLLLLHLYFSFLHLTVNDFFHSCNHCYKQTARLTARQRSQLVRLGSVALSYLLFYMHATFYVFLLLMRTVLFYAGWEALF